MGIILVAGRFTTSSLHLQDDRVRCPSRWNKQREINLTDQISVLIHVSEASTTIIKSAIVLLTVVHRLGQFRMRVEKQSFI
jgi:hypothetical protein